MRASTGWGPGRMWKRWSRSAAFSGRRCNACNPLLTKLGETDRQSGLGLNAMTVLTIRAHKRYAVRQPIWLRRPLDGFQVTGLMIELSTEGCRLSSLGSSDFATGDLITVEGDQLKLAGRIRWTRQGISGVRLIKPLAAEELDAHLLRLRGPNVRVAYGARIAL